MLCRHPLKAREGAGRPQEEGRHETWGYQPAALGSTGNGSSLGSGYSPSIYLRGGGKLKAGLGPRGAQENATLEAACSPEGPSSSASAPAPPKAEKP